MKKLISLLLALMMVLSLATVAFASEVGSGNGIGNLSLGSITINGVSSEVQYDLYKLLDLESYDEDEGVYSYKVNTTWAPFFETDAAKAYFKVDTQGYATWINASTDENTTVAEFAKLALAYAKTNNITPVKSSATEGDFEISGTNGTFHDLDLGYYLVDSTMGALCGLTTTNPDAYIVAKNGTPTLDKQVQEDSTGNWGGSDTADIGQTVEFRTTITVQPGAENYILHDKMSTGLTFGSVTGIKHVINGKTEDDATEVPADYYEVVTTGLTDGCTFEVRFTDEFCEHIKKNDKVIVHYTATLNENAVIAGDGNINDTYLEFGEDKYTSHDSTQTYTFAFDLVKTDGQNKLIDGAEFKIYDTAELGTGNEIKVVKLADGSYRRAMDDEDGVAIEVKDGKVRVSGFDNGTYYLEETKTPQGYNQLAARKEFTISNGNLDAIITNNIVSTGSGVHVVNQSGTMLPETGATGTALFIGFGMFVMLTTGVLLVTKKRMSMIEE